MKKHILKNAQMTKHTKKIVRPVMKNNTKSVVNNPVYIKLEYDESRESKKDLLTAEASLLNIIRTLQRFSSIRQEEFKIKSQLAKAVKDLNLKIRQTKSTFPFLEVPEKAQIEQIKTRISSGAQKEEMIVDTNLEEELRQINEKLRALG